MRTNQARIDAPSIRDRVFHCDFGEIRHLNVKDMKIRRIKARIALDKKVRLGCVGARRKVGRWSFPEAGADDRVVLKISSDARQMHDGLDAKMRELGLIAD